jgi:hypothetical protein
MQRFAGKNVLVTGVDLKGTLLCTHEFGAAHITGGFLIADGYHMIGA